jgi:hypothetical protein
LKKARWLRNLLHGTEKRDGRKKGTFVQNVLGIGPSIYCKRIKNLSIRSNQPFWIFRKHPFPLLITDHEEKVEEIRR